MIALPVYLTREQHMRLDIQTVRRLPFARPFIKYTPTWPRSFMPTSQKQRNMIAKMKLIPVQELIEGKSLLTD